MKIMIIGKNGQLGQELLIKIRDLSYDVHPLGHEELDITDYAKVKNAIEKYKPDWVINASAQHATLDSEKHPENPFDVNAFAVKNLSLVCKEKDIRFITYSSDYVFDGTKGPYKEYDRPSPVQIFGVSKYIGEIMALNYNSQSIVIRTCGLYGGLTGSRSKRNFVLNILEEAKNKKTMHVSLEQIVSPTYVSDLVKATMQVIEKELEGGIYHLVNEGFCSWAEFSKEVMQIRGLDVKIDPIDRKGTSGGLRRPLFSALVNTEAKKQGIELPHWKDGLKRYLSFLSTYNI